MTFLQMVDEFISKLDSNNKSIEMLKFYRNAYRKQFLGYPCDWNIEQKILNKIREIQNEME
jgi:hypothetical protein